MGVAYLKKIVAEQALEVELDSELIPRPGGVVGLGLLVGEEEEEEVGQIDVRQRFFRHRHRLC